MVQKSEINVEELRKGGVVKLKDKDMYALWIKTACCNLTSKQLKKIADITDKYARSYLLFTTRQIPIIPFINLKDVEEVKSELSQVYLELDRCGPRVRNINVCYDDKICPEAVTNPLSLGEKLDNFFNDPINYKIKIGVAGCKKDCIISRVLTDIGFVGVERNGKAGYEVHVGGRLGLNPFVGVKMARCLSEEECIKFVHNYFDLIRTKGKEGERGADLINRLGVEAVKQNLNTNLKEGSALKPIKCETRSREKETDKMILRIRATCGEVTSQQLRKIANIAQNFGKGLVHFTVLGSPEIPCIDRRHLENIGQQLYEAGMQLLDKGIDNIQACFGNYCTEGIVDSQSLLRKLEKRIEELDLNNLNIKVSAAGCPNSCAIAHLTDIGFYGVIEPEVDVTKCMRGCKLCVPVCKRKAIIKDGAAIIDKEKCKYCGQCIAVCPFDALIAKRRGFAVFVGGKNGEETRLGEVVAEFLSEEETLQVAEGCLKLVKKKNANIAAIVDAIGIEKLNELIVPSTK